MKNNSTVVATVIHDKSLKNLNSFLDSIYLQNDKKFDLMILNDSKKKLIFKKKNPSKYYLLNIRKALMRTELN